MVHNDVWEPVPRTHTYSGAKCPLVVQPDTKYIVCEKIGYVFDKLPVYLPLYEEEVATNNSPEAEIGPADTYDRLINYDDKTFSDMKKSFFMDTYYTENQQRLFFTHMNTLFHELYSPKSRKRIGFCLKTRYTFTQLSLTQWVATTGSQPTTLQRVSKYRKYTNLVQKLKMICRAVKLMRPKNTSRQPKKHNQTGWHLKGRPPRPPTPPVEEGCKPTTPQKQTGWHLKRRQPPLQTPPWRV